MAKRIAYTRVLAAQNQFHYAAQAALNDRSGLHRSSRRRLAAELAELEAEAEVGVEVEIVDEGLEADENEVAVEDDEVAVEIGANQESMTAHLRIKPGIERERMVRCRRRIMSGGFTERKPHLAKVKPEDIAIFRHRVQTEQAKRRAEVEDWLNGRGVIAKGERLYWGIPRVHKCRERGYWGELVTVEKIQYCQAGRLSDEDRTFFESLSRSERKLVLTGQDGEYDWEPMEVIGYSTPKGSWKRERVRHQWQKSGAARRLEALRIKDAA